MSQPSAIAQRLLAHAKLCRQIAGECWDKEMARKLEQLAQDCLDAAGQLESAARTQDNVDSDTATA
jgi:hypothetical protein